MTFPRFKQHALSKIFPDMEDADLQALTDDIKANGLHESIVLYKGEVLDGWHRYQACELSGTNPRTIDYKGKNPAAFVKSKNWHRRHLTESQRAFAQVQLSEWAESGNPIGKGAAAAPLVTVKEMAKEAGTGERIIQQAKRVEESGSVVLKEAVKDGEISIEKAAAISKLPKSEQSAAMKEKPKPAAKVKPVVAEADPDAGGDTLKELEAAVKEIEKKDALIESLKKSDLAKEVAAWSLKYDQLEGRLNQSITTQNAAEKHASYYSSLLFKIRKALNVQKDKLIVPAIEVLQGQKVAA